MAQEKLPSQILTDRFFNHTLGVLKDNTPEAYFAVAQALGPDVDDFLKLVYLHGAYDGSSYAKGKAEWQK